MEKSNVIIQMRTTPVSCLSSIMVSGLKTAPSAPKTTTGVQLVSLFQSSNTKSKNAEEWCAEIVAQEIISSLPPMMMMLVLLSHLIAPFMSKINSPVLPHCHSRRSGP